jgi:branched-chain amino acid transport system ATP-binding protein
MDSADGTLADAGEAALEVENVTKLFGGVTAVDGCTLTVARNSITGLIGPNGSGKTTLFNIVAGMLPAQQGRVHFRGHNILGLKPHVIFRMGMSRTFQITRLFPKMTVLENLRVIPARSGEEVKQRRDAEEFLKLFNLWELHDRYAEDLSYGQMKLLELARALISNPYLVMLDEPFAGVNRVLAVTLVELIRRFQAQGTTFFLIDHEMKIVLDICERIYVMDSGEIITQGPPDKVRQDPRVLDAYFGR